MSLYVIEEKLTTSPGEKATSWAMAAVITAALILLLYFLKITVSNPPFEVKQGVVELDFGIVDGGFGQPTDGGPSPTPPAQGGETSEGGTASPQSGGAGNVVTNEGEKSTTTLPPIEPPQSNQPSGDPRLARQSGGKRNGTTSGTANGFPGGSGRTGSGPGGNNGGVTGNGGTRPGGVGTGLWSHTFTRYKFSSTINKVNADGEGVIVCRVSVDCGGRSSVIEYGSRGTTYSGSVSNLRQVFDYFLSNSTFTRKTENCDGPESGLVTLVVKRTI